MVGVLGVLVPIVLFIVIAAIIISNSYFKNRRMERTALIASGKGADIFNEGDRKPAYYLALKFGLLLIGLGIGLLMGDYLENITQMPEPVAYLSMMFLFGGIGLIAYYLIQKRIIG